MAGVHHAMSGAAAAALGVKTLKEVVFNASGNFVVPANAIDNKFYVGCTGGGGGGTYATFGEYNSYGFGGGGSGRVSATLQLTPNDSITITVGAGGGGTNNGTASPGGTTSFGNLVSCPGGLGGQRFVIPNNGRAGGGNGGGTSAPVTGVIYAATASNCPAMFTVDPTAIDNTNKFYTAKSYVYTNNSARAGGAGCYWRGGEQSTETTYARPNTGGGGVYVDGNIPNSAGGSGKVVIYYYTYE